MLQAFILLLIVDCLLRHWKCYLFFHCSYFYLFCVLNKMQGKSSMHNIGKFNWLKAYMEINHSDDRGKFGMPTKQLET